MSKGSNRRPTDAAKFSENFDRIFRKPHQFDDDAVCTVCGFDGAEWQHWKTQTYEGRALAGPDGMKMPQCGEYA